MSSYPHWLGLLKWSLAQSDGTTSSNVEPMTKEKLEWFSEVMKEFVKDEPARLSEILIIFTDAYDRGVEDSHNERFEILLEEILDIIENIDLSLIFCKCGGMVVLMKLLQNSILSISNKCQIAVIIGTLAQNNPLVQSEMLLSNTLSDIILYVISLTKTILSTKTHPIQQLIYKLLYSISCIVRSHHLAEEYFVIQCHGMEFLYYLLTTHSSSPTPSSPSYSFITCQCLVRIISFIHYLLTSDYVLLRLVTCPTSTDTNTTATTATTSNTSQIAHEIVSNNPCASMELAITGDDVVVNRGQQQQQQHLPAHKALPCDDIPSPPSPLSPLSLTAETVTVTNSSISNSSVSLQYVRHIKFYQLFYSIFMPVISLPIDISGKMLLLECYQILHRELEQNADLGMLLNINALTHTVTDEKSIRNDIGNDNQRAHSSNDLFSTHARMLYYSIQRRLSALYLAGRSYEEHSVNESGGGGGGDNYGIGKGNGSGEVKDGEGDTKWSLQDAIMFEQQENIEYEVNEKKILLVDMEVRSSASATTMTALDEEDKQVEIKALTNVVLHLNRWKSVK